MGIIKPLYGKSKAYYEKKKAKALEIIKICDERLAEM